MALSEGIGRGPFGSEAIRVRVRHFFRNGDEGLKMERLHRPIEHGGNRQRPTFAVLLRDINPSKRLGPVAPPFQHGNGFCFLLRGLPDDPVDTRSSLSLVGGDSPDGQDAGRQRAGEDPLQGFHLARFPVPVRLRDTKLELSDVLAELFQTSRFEKIRCQGNLRSVVLVQPSTEQFPLNGFLRHFQRFYFLRLPSKLPSFFFLGPSVNNFLPFSNLLC